jgi:hypothetical protein
MSTFSSGLNPIYHILFNLLKSQKLVTIIPFIDTVPYIEKQLMEFPRVQY